MDREITRPNREPDLIVSDRVHPSKILELWLDEGIEGFNTGEKLVYGLIKFKSDVLYYRNKGRWLPYGKDTFFKDIVNHVSNFIENRILLGEDEC